MKKGSAGRSSAGLFFPSGKKGEVSLEALVKLIPHILITIGLAAIAVYVILIFTATTKTSEEQDFQRVLAEVDDLIQSEFVNPQAITVPIQAESALKITTYPAGSVDLPKQCQGQSCICLYAVKESKLIATCKLYTQIARRCGTDKCGDLCFSSVKTLSLPPGQTTVTVTRGCHELSIT